MELSLGSMYSSFKNLCFHDRLFQSFSALSTPYRNPMEQLKCNVLFNSLSKSHKTATKTKYFLVVLADRSVRMTALSTLTPFWNRIKHICPSAFDRKRAATVPSTYTKESCIPKTVNFHWEPVLSTAASRLVDFRQRIMVSCWNAISASQAGEGASSTAKHGEQRDQARLDTCIPDTRGWCPVRKHTGLSCLGQKLWKSHVPEADRTMCHPWLALLFGPLYR